MKNVFMRILKHLLIISLSVIFSFSSAYAGEMKDKDCESCGNDLTGVENNKLASISKHVMSAVDKSDKPMDAGLQSSICINMKKNIAFEDLNSALVERGRETFENEYKNIKCTVTSDPFKPKVGPFKVLTHFPSGLSTLAKGIFNYFHKKLKRLDLLRNAINTPDKEGLTILDYHANVYQTLPESSKPAMRSLRKRLCAYGGAYSTFASSKNCDDVKKRYK